MRARRQRLRACGPLRAPHRVNLRGAFGQWMCGPTLAAILAAEHLTAAGRAVHALGLPRVEGEREHRGPRLHAHVDFRPAHAAVLAAEQHADFALKVGARGHPDGLRIAGDLADVAAVGLPVGIQRLEPSAGPVFAAIRAAEETRAPDREDLTRAPAPDQHAVHVHGVVVHVLAVAHVLPVLTAVEAADDAADFDGAVDLVGIRRIGGQLQDALRRIGPGGDRHFWEADGDRELSPALTAVLAAIDLAILVSRVHHLRIARIERQRPDGQAVVRHVELLPVISAIGAPIRAVLSADIDGVGVLGVRGDRSDGGRGGQAAGRDLPAIVAGRHTIETGLHGPARGGFAREPDIHVGLAIQRHGALLTFIVAPRPAGPQPRDGLPREPPTFIVAPRPAGPQPRDGLQREPPTFIVAPRPGGAPAPRPA